MFKGILPPRRAPSPEFTIVSPLVENGKENMPNPPARRPEAPSTPNGKVAAAPKSAKATTTQDKSKRRKGDIPPHTAPATNSTDREFDRLLVRACHELMSPDNPALSSILISCCSQDDLQIPSTLRPKLVGMESSVKAAMLKSSHVLDTPPAPARGLRRVQSGSSLNLESSPNKGADLVPDPSQHRHHRHPATPPGAQVGSRDATTAAAQHSRGVSVDVVSPRRPKSRTGFSASGAPPDLGATAPRGKVFSPVQFVSLLTGKSSLELEVDVVKKLVLLLRNEAAR